MIKKVGLFINEWYVWKISISFFRMPNFGLCRFVSLFVSSLTAVCLLKHFGWRKSWLQHKYSIKWLLLLSLHHVFPFTIVNFYFEKKRGLANGIVWSASGISTIVNPTMYRQLIDIYGIHGAMIIVGVILLNICVGASFSVSRNVLEDRQLLDY
jgi:hypothetical protein